MHGVWAPIEIWVNRRFSFALGKRLHGYAAESMSSRIMKGLESNSNPLPKKASRKTAKHTAS
jgi:hypothetical protein